MTKIMDKLLSFVSLIGAAMFAVPLSILLLGALFPYSTIIMPVFAVLFTVMGYGLMSLYAKIIKKRASEDGFGLVSEGIFNGFRLKYCAPVALLLLILTIPATMLFSFIMRTLWLNAVIFNFNSFNQLEFAAVFFTSSLVGTVIWFYPVQKLSNIYVLIGGSCVYYIETFMAFFISKSFGEGFSVLNLGLPFVVFNISLLLIFNQSNLQKQYKSSIVSEISPYARLYNFYLVIVIILLFIAVCALVYVILSGLSVIFNTILYVLLRTALRSSSKGEMVEYEYVDSDDAMNKFEKEVLRNNGAAMLNAFWALAAVTVLIIIGVKTGILKKWFIAVKQWLYDAFYTVIVGVSLFKSAGDEEELDTVYNYKDEKKRLQKALVRDYDKMADETDTYKQFMTRLGRLKNYDEQLSYAYKVLLKTYQKMNISLKQSDTPREVEGKVVRVMTTDTINKITSDFERIKYAEDVPSGTEAAAVLENICGEIKRYLY